MKWRFNFMTWIYGIGLNAVLSACFMTFGELFAGHRDGAIDCISHSFKIIGLVAIFSVPFSFPVVIFLVLAESLTELFDNPVHCLLFIAGSCLVGTLLSYCVFWFVMGMNPFTQLSSVVPASFVAVIIALLINRNLFYKSLKNF